MSKQNAKKIVKSSKEVAVKANNATFEKAIACKKTKKVKSGQRGEISKTAAVASKHQLIKDDGKYYALQTF